MLNPTEANQIPEAKTANEIPNLVLFSTQNSSNKKGRLITPSCKFHGIKILHWLQPAGWLFQHLFAQQQWFHCCCRQTAASRTCDGTRQRCRRNTQVTWMPDLMPKSRATKLNHICPNWNKSQSLTFRIESFIYLFIMLYKCYLFIMKSYTRCNRKQTNRKTKLLTCT